MQYSVPTTSACRGVGRGKGEQGGQPPSMSDLGWISVGLWAAQKNLECRIWVWDLGSGIWNLRCSIWLFSGFSPAGFSKAENLRWIASNVFFQIKKFDTRVRLSLWLTFFTYLHLFLLLVPSGLSLNHQTGWFMIQRSDSSLPNIQGAPGLTLDPCVLFFGGCAAFRLLSERAGCGLGPWLWLSARAAHFW